jgi:hypothetical protein
MATMHLQPIEASEKPLRRLGTPGPHESPVTMGSGGVTFISHDLPYLRRGQLTFLVVRCPSISTPLLLPVVLGFVMYCMTNRSM